MASTRQNDYRDLDLDFIAHPITGDVVKKVEPDAVARSLRNLVMTSFYDRPFRPHIGSNVRRLLFEPISSLTARQLEELIKEVCANFEPRATIIGAQALVNAEETGYYVKIVFSVNNRPEPYQITVFLERIR